MNATELLRQLAPSPRAGSEDAYAWLVENGFPTRREEEWRYTPIEGILATGYRPTAGSAGLVDRPTLDELVGAHGDVRIVCVNGAFRPELSALELAPFGVRCSHIGAAAPTPFLATSRPDALRVLNTVVTAGSVEVVVAADVHVVEPIHVVHVSVPGRDASASHPSTRVEVRARSKATVIESYVGVPGTALTNAATTIVAGAHSQVTHHRVQAEPAGTVHFGHTTIDARDDTRIRSTSILLGSDTARVAIDAVLVGKGATLELRGLAVSTRRQHHDNVVTVEHAASGASSVQLFKAVVDDHARGSFSGRVFVAPGTTGSVAHQMSRSLVLSPTAQADTRPWLEILADDVVCTHGAAVGRLSDEALFYLRTRGLPAAEARKMLIGAFASEIVDDLEPSSLRTRIGSLVARQLHQTSAA